MKRFISRHWDLLLSTAAAIECFQLVPRELPVTFLRDAYSTGIAVLAVVFSVVFAAITLLASVGDDEFIDFLEEEDCALTALLKSFTATLNILFGALIISIVAFGWSRYAESQARKEEPSWEFAVFCFSLLYALIASRLVGNDVIRFATLRARFISSKGEGKSSNRKHR